MDDPNNLYCLWRPSIKYSDLVRGKENYFSIQNKLPDFKNDPIINVGKFR